MFAIFKCAQIHNTPDIKKNTDVVAYDCRQGGGGGGGRGDVQTPKVDSGTERGGEEK